MAKSSTEFFIVLNKILFLEVKVLKIGIGIERT